MTEQEAIEKIKYRTETASGLTGRGVDGKAFEDLEIAISALEELQQYRALGTVKELREATVKQVPKKPIDCVEKYLTGRKNYFYRCSCCDGVVDDTFDKYCRFCGQAIDWSDAE